jgi:hypothetical protein
MCRAMTRPTLGVRGRMGETMIELHGNSLKTDLSY